MAEDDPCDAAVLELLGRDLTGESAVGLVVDVLGSDLDTLAEVLAREEEVESGGSNDDLCCASAWLLARSFAHELLTSVGVELGIVQVLDNLLDGLDGAVPVFLSALARSKLELTALPRLTS